MQKTGILNTLNKSSNERAGSTPTYQQLLDSYYECLSLQSQSNDSDDLLSFDNFTTPTGDNVDVSSRIPAPIDVNRLLSGVPELPDFVEYEPPRVVVQQPIQQSGPISIGDHITILGRADLSNALTITSYFGLNSLGPARVRLHPHQGVPCNDLALSHYISEAKLYRSEFISFDDVYNFFDTPRSGTYIRGFIGVSPFMVLLFMQRLQEIQRTDASLFYRALAIDKQVWCQYLMLSDRSNSLINMFTTVIMHLSQRDRMFFSSFAGSTGTYVHPAVEEKHAIAVTRSKVGSYSGTERRIDAYVVWLDAELPVVYKLMELLITSAVMGSDGQYPCTPYFMIHGWQSSSIPHMIFFESHADFVGAQIFYLAQNLRHHFLPESGAYNKAFQLPSWIAVDLPSMAHTFTGGYACSKFDHVDFSTVDERLNVALTSPINEPASVFYQLAIEAMFSPTFTFRIPAASDRSYPDQFISNIPIKFPPALPTIFNAGAEYEVIDMGPTIDQFPPLVMSYLGKPTPIETTLTTEARAPKPDLFAGFKALAPEVQVVADAIPPPPSYEEATYIERAPALIPKLSESRPYKPNQTNRNKNNRSQKDQKSNNQNTPKPKNNLNNINRKTDQKTGLRRHQNKQSKQDDVDTDVARPNIKYVRRNGGYALNDQYLPKSTDF